MKWEQFLRFSCSLLIFFSLLSSFSSSVSSQKADHKSCDECCKASNFVADNNTALVPLNLSNPTEVPFNRETEGAQVFLRHCRGFFTHFQWFRLRRYNKSEAEDPSVQLDDPRLEPFPWEKDGRVGFPSGDNQTLVISSLKLEDEGLYVYAVSNGTDLIAGKIFLVVNCRERDPSFATDLSPKQAVALGSSKTLRCAVNKADCKGETLTARIFWSWQKNVSEKSVMLLNGTLPNVNVVCDVGSYFGFQCDVMIDKVEEELFEGVFVCKLNENGLSNKTVQLVHLRTGIRSWLPYVLTITGGVVSLAALIGWAWWRYGHRVIFQCRSQPCREGVEMDAVVLCGEDYEQVASDILVPGVQALGYQAACQLTPLGRPELTDKLKAVENSHSVILTFSAREMAEDGHIDFLTKYVFNRKARSTVLFVRCDDNIPPPGTTQTVSYIHPNIHNGLDKDSTHPKILTKNAWKTKAVQSFKVLRLPQSLHPGMSEEGGLREARTVEKFWYNVQRHLPKPGSGKTPRNRSLDQQEWHGGFSNSFGEKCQPLEDSHSAERHNARISNLGALL